MASTAEKLDPELWEEAKADAREKFGGHSARAMQYAVKLYKQRGGRYKGPKKKDNRLKQWSDQDWTTKSGRPSRETGERYLPRAAIESLTSAEYGATTRAKRRGGGVGAVVAQPTSIREKTRKFRKVNPMKAKAATPAQIAARKKFAERARSGELAKMRKKSTRKSNPTANQEYSKLELVRSVADEITAYAKARGGMDKNDFMKAARILKKGDLREARNFAATLDSDPRDYLLSMMDGLRQNNPTATRAPERKRTKLIQNGERKKNPVLKTFPAYDNFRFKVETSKDGVNFKNPVGFPTKISAINYAKMLAEENPDLFIRVYELTAVDLGYAV